MVLESIMFSNYLEEPGKLVGRLSSFQPSSEAGGEKQIGGMTAGSSKAKAAAPSGRRE